MLELKECTSVGGETISHSKHIVIVGGCGHVGLPLGIVLADSGFTVDLLDVNENSISLVNDGIMPFMEEDASPALTRMIGRNLRATSNTSCLRNADVVITVIGTPVDQHQNPTTKALNQSIDQLLPQMKEGALLVLRSTVYPGTTKLVYDRIQESGYKIHLAFCPERIAEGKALREIRQFPQIVSSFDTKALELARSLFASIAPSLIELHPLEAELAKLFSNSWRYLNFAVSNQFFMLAESCGLDFYRIYDAITCEYPRMKSFASAGFAAGPCLLKDTLQLAAFANYNFFLGHAAMLVNEGMPNCIVQQLRTKFDLSRQRVAILGMAFKAESDDNRESLSYKLKHLLEVEAKEVICTDPFVKDDHLVPLDTAIASADIVVLGAPHHSYLNINIPSDKYVVDMWGFWNRSYPNKTSADSLMKEKVEVNQ